MPGPDAFAPLTADRLVAGRYRLVGPIARGGMAEVWSGLDEVLARPVAVKVLLSHLALDPAVKERFRREAVTAARLAHPNVVATFDTGVDGDLAYIVMELVPGRTLRDLLAAGALPVPTAVSVADQIAAALAAAHHAGLVHRDIKPANVLVAEDDGQAVRVKVTDFGIAKAAEEVGGDLTVAGTVVGTPKYLSPEQVEGREPDARADLYALGVVLFEMLTGRPPFEGPTQMATALSHLRDEAPRVSSLRPGVPAALDDLVASLLTKDPEGRYASATAVRAALMAVPLTGPAFPQAPRPAQTATATRPAVPVTAPSPWPGTDPITAPVRPDATAVASVVTPDHPLGRKPGGRPTRPAGGAGAARVRTPPPRRLRRWVPGLVVAALVVAGGVVAAVVLGRAGASRSHGTGVSASHGTAAPPPATAGAPPLHAAPLDAVRAEVVIAPGHTPDDASAVGDVLTGAAPGWESDLYANARFGNLYPGIGLAVELSGTAALRQLTVTSTTTGWTAEVFVGTVAPPAEGLTDPASVYGPATAAGTATGTTTTFALGGRRGDWVLLWLTSTGGPPYHAALTRLVVR